jgi:Glycosyl transferase family 2
MTAPKSISILIEWENAIVADQTRPLRMLERVRDDIKEIGPENIKDVEIVSGFDPLEIDSEFIETMLRESLSEVPWVTLRTLSLAGADYYEMKNICAVESRGEVIILLDSDVIPERGWLTKLIESFNNAEVLICASSVHLAHNSLLEKTLALIWIFELAPLGTGVVKTSSIWVNSTAYRRHVLLKFPLPPSDGTARASCAAHVRELRAAGVPMHRRIDAHVEHPAPIGVSEFVIRALARGRDKVLGSPKSFWGSVGFEVKRGLGFIAKRRRDAGVKNVYVPLVLVIASAWWLLMILGGLAAMIAPKEMRKRLQL